MKKYLIIISFSGALALGFAIHSCGPLNHLSDQSSFSDPLNLDTVNSLEDIVTVAQKAGDKLVAYTSNGGENAVLSLSDLGACVVMYNETLRCWGYNATGQLGEGTTTLRKTPVASTNVTDKVVAVTAALNHTCIYTYNGLKCFGDQTNGKLGDTVDAIVKIYSPVSATVHSGRSIKSMAAGDEHVCVLYGDDKSVACYGLNTNGQLGDGTTTKSTTPKTVSLGGEQVKSIATSDNSSCAITTSGKLYCWGLNFISPANSPNLIATNASKIASGEKEHLCYITTDQTVACFGKNDQLQLGKTPTDASFKATPNTVSGIVNADAVVAGAAHSCAITDNFTNIYCWGGNSKGQLGTGSSTPASSATPLQVTGLPNGVGIVDIASQDRVVCTLLKNDDVWCWGNNDTSGTGGSLDDNLGVSAAQVATFSATPIKILNRKDP